MRRAAGLAIALVAAVAGAAPPCPPAPGPCCQPRTLGPAAAAHTRVWRHGRTTCRVTRRTPAVMWEDAARMPRGEIFSTWENAARQ
ncbi:MAG: hypothetical protein ACKOSQ_07835 [Planctomycetaceae bacterium]